MNEDWISIALAVIVFIVSGLVAYFNTKSSITSMVTYLISQAESTALSGAEKMEQVVSQVYETIPGAFKVLFPKASLEKIAQSAFDYMKEYALAWAEKKDAEAATKED